MTAERWAVGLLGTWTLAVAFVAPGHRLVGLSDLLAGVAVAIAGISMVRNRRIRGGLSTLLGLWLFAGAFVQPLHLSGGLISNNIIVGLAIALVGFVPYDRR